MAVSGQLTLLALTKTTFIMENKVDECSCGYYQQDFLCKAHGDDDGDDLNTIHDEEQEQEEGCICSYDHQDILCRAHEDNDEAVEEKSSQSQSPNMAMPRNKRSLLDDQESLSLLDENYNEEADEEESSQSQYEATPNMAMVKLVDFYPQCIHCHIG